MSVCISIHPSSDGLVMYGKPDPMTSYSLSGHVEISVSSPFSFFCRSRPVSLLLHSLVLTFEGQCEIASTQTGYAGARVCSIAQEMVLGAPIELDHIQFEGSNEPSRWRVVFDMNLPGWLPATSPFGADRELGTSYSLHASAQYTLSEEDLTFDWPILGYCMPWLSRFRYARAMSEINLERVANIYDNSPLASYLFNSSPSPDSLLDPAFKLQVLASLPDYINISDEQIPLVLRVRTKDVEAETYKDVQILSLRTDFLQLESAGSQIPEFYKALLPPKSCQPPNLPLKRPHPIAALYDLGLDDTDTCLHPVVHSERSFLPADSGHYVLAGDNSIAPTPNSGDASTWITMNVDTPFTPCSSKKDGSRHPQTNSLRPSATNPLFTIRHTLSVSLTYSCTTQSTSHVSKTPRAPKPASKPAKATSTKPRARRAQATKMPPPGHGSKDSPMDIDHSDSAAMEPARGGKGKNKAVAEVIASDNLKVGGQGATDADTEIVVISNNPTRTQKATVSRADLEKESLKKQVYELQRVISSHRQTLEEVLAVRNTEAEQILEEQRQLWETRLATQQETIQELTSNLARVEPLSRSGTGSVLHLLTRDAADEEKKALVSEIAQLKATIAEKNSIIADRDKRILDYTQQERELRYEIKMLEERKPSTKPTARIHNAPADPKSGEIIRFYEDMTELPVVSITHQGVSQYSNDDEWLLRCIYSVSDTTGNEESRSFSLDFSIRTRFEPSSEGKTKETLHYIPLSLDKEKSEIVDRLDFLKAPFTFERSQLAVFLRTLRDTLTEAVSPQDDQEDSRTAIEIDS
ncbi:hypothetical protein EYR40_000923 [Pleurotus pulmonarius]|nr:hypothetical protein EYR38_004168 [Pleurotus pulmonarius]KAF4608578.1 hypothetical protein EYR40_000923 [Pleurotus pulmonarius]